MINNYPPTITRIAITLKQKPPTSLKAASSKDQFSFTGKSTVDEKKEMSPWQKIPVILTTLGAIQLSQFSSFLHQEHSHDMDAPKHHPTQPHDTHTPVKKIPLKAVPDAAQHFPVKLPVNLFLSLFSLNTGSEDGDHGHKPEHEDGIEIEVLRDLGLYTKDYEAFVDGKTMDKLKNKFFTAENNDTQSFILNSAFRMPGSKLEISNEIPSSLAEEVNKPDLYVVRYELSDDTEIKCTISRKGKLSTPISTGNITKESIFHTLKPFVKSEAPNLAANIAELPATSAEKAILVKFLLDQAVLNADSN